MHREGETSKKQLSAIDQIGYSPQAAGAEIPRPVFVFVAKKKRCYLCPPRK